MNNIPRPTLSEHNRVPGGMPLIKSDKYVKDLCKLTRVELLEIRDREKHLISNIKNFDRLPDKGLRLKDFYAKVLAELESRESIDEAAAMFSQLNIATKAEKILNKMEWNGGHVNSDGRFVMPESADPAVDVLDSDDELEMDPLRVIATRQMHERRVKILKPEQSLITERDLEEIKSFASDSIDSGLSDDISEIIAVDVGAKLESTSPKLQQILKQSSATKSESIASSHSRHSNTPSSNSAIDVDHHARYLMEMGTMQTTSPQREKFKPYKTTITDVHDPDKERIRSKGKYWEVTAATPPLIQHSATKMIPLQESVDIQTQYLAKVKDLQEKQAVDRLDAKMKRMESTNIKMPNAETLRTSDAFTKYRSTKNRIEGRQQYEEDDEVLDPLDEEIPGGVVNYSVFE